MCLLYAVSFIFSVFGIFGVGHLFAGVPTKAAAYFAAGIIWTIAAGALGLSSGFSLFICFVPLHLLFAHFCAANAVKLARGEEDF